MTDIQAELQGLLPKLLAERQARRGRPPRGEKFDPMKHRQPQVRQLLEARRQGKELWECALLAGMPSRTLCDWLARSAEFCRAWDQAGRDGKCPRGKKHRQRLL